MLCRVMLLVCLFVTLAHCSSNDTLTNRQTPWFRSKLALRWWNFAARTLFKLSGALAKKTDPSEALPKDPESKMTSIELIIHRGYPAQVYYVTTEDGYILELHRIPAGKGKSAEGEKGRPVFIQHGFLGSSADWLIGPNDRALGFKLADLGYDVWLGNCRGNTYSRRHKYLDTNEQAYWNFSWDEMGRYDIPAVIDFILAETKRKKLVYVGYSMGCAMFFVCMSTRPSYNDKIETMIGLAPAVSLGNMASPVIRAVAPFVKQIEFMLRMLGTRDLFSNDVPLNQLQSTYCLGNQQRALLCRNILFLIIGHDTASLELDLLPIIDGHVPSGASVRTAAHFALNYNSGQTFILYDFGRKENLRKYGTEKPPPYKLRQVTAPVYLFYSDNDLLVRKPDVFWLAEQLPNVKRVIRVDDPQYNHFGFMWNSKNNALLNDRLVSYLPN